MVRFHSISFFLVKLATTLNRRFKFVIRLAEEVSGDEGNLAGVSCFEQSCIQPYVRQYILAAWPVVLRSQLCCAASSAVQPALEFGAVGALSASKQCSEPTEQRTGLLSGLAAQEPCDLHAAGGRGAVQEARSWSSLLPEGPFEWSTFCNRFSQHFQDVSCRISATSSEFLRIW